MSPMALTLAFTISQVHGSVSVSENSDSLLMVAPMRLLVLELKIWGVEL